MQLKECNGIKAQESVYIKIRQNLKSSFSFQTGWAPSSFSISFINIYIEHETRVDPSMGVSCVSHQKMDS